MSDAMIEVLRKNLGNLESSVRWLTRSYTRCKAIGLKTAYSEVEFDAFENLTSRFARTTDLIVSKVLRTIDAVELLDTGSVIDSANRAEKRGIIDSVSGLRKLKDLRNEIDHEYEAEDLQGVFGMVLDSVPELLTMAGRIKAYCGTYLEE